MSEQEEHEAITKFLELHNWSIGQKTVGSYCFFHAMGLSRERADKAEARVKELEVRSSLSYAIDLENKVKKLESAWQDAELRADKNLKRVKELEASLRRVREKSTMALSSLSTASKTLREIEGVGK
jgi:hypothetical protein